MHEMMQVIPKLNYRLGQVVLVAKRAQARGAQQKIFSALGFHSQPARDQYSQNVPARKNQNVALDRTHAVNHTVGARSNLGGRFPTGATVAEQLPARTLGMDLRGAQTLVFAVIPFDQVMIDIGLIAEASQLAGPRRALRRTGKYPGETPHAERFPELAGVALAALGER